MRDFGSGRVLLIRNELTSQFGFIGADDHRDEHFKVSSDWSSAVKRC